MSEEVTAPATGAEQAVAPDGLHQAHVDDAQNPQSGAEIIEAQQSGEEQPQENKGSQRLQLRFSELTARIKAEQEEKEYWRQQATRPVEPEPAQVDEYGENPYSPEALQAVVQRALAEERQKAAQRDAQTAQAQKAQSLQSKLFESGLEGAVLIASGANIPFTEAMIDALAVSEQAAGIAHHLGTNPAEAARIAALPPQLQGYELAKLESRLASQPKTTNAPPPPSTVGNRAAPGPGLRDDMNADDWRKAFNEQMRARR